MIRECSVRKETTKLSSAEFVTWHSRQQHMGSQQSSWAELAQQHLLRSANV